MDLGHMFLFVFSFSPSYSSFLVVPSVVSLDYKYALILTRLFKVTPIIFTHASELKFSSSHAGD